MTEATEYKRVSALCTGCGTANPPHELWEVKCLKCVGTELAEERQKREQAEKSAAGMREALQAVVDFGTCERVGKQTCNENRAATNGAGEQCVYCQCEEALNGNAGRNWVPADRFKEVVAAFEAAMYLATADCYLEQEAYDRAKAALARAKEVQS